MRPLFPRLALAATTLLSVSAAHAQIDPYRGAPGSATMGIYQDTAAGWAQVGEVYTEPTGAVGSAQHWVFFEDYAPERAIVLQPSGAAYPGLAAFLDATRHAGSSYVPLGNGDRACAATPVCETLPADRDALIKASETERNFGASQSLTVSAGATGVRHALLHFDTGRLPHAAAIVSAELTLTRLLGTGAPAVHVLGAGWDEADVSWASFSRSGARFGAGPAGPYHLGVEARVPATPAGGTITTSLRGVVQGWVDGTLTNHGLLLESDGLETSVVYASSESPELAARPQLRVCWVPCADTCPAGCGPGEACAGGECRRPMLEGLCFGEAPVNEESCSGHGLSLYGRCFCVPGFTGENCETPVVVDESPDCSGNGLLFNGSCFCYPGFAGDRCEQVPVEATCPEACSGHGLCRFGTCYCDVGYGGEACRAL